MKRWLATLVLIAVAAPFAGCGDEDDPTAPGTPSEKEVRDRLQREVSDRTVGYSLRVPFDWTTVSDPKPGDTVAFKGGGEGCVLASSGPVPDPSDLVDHVREQVTGATGEVEVRHVRALRAAAAIAEAPIGEQYLRALVIAGPGGSVTLGCQVKDKRRADQISDLLPYIAKSASLPIPKEAAELQPKLADLPGVKAAAVREFARGTRVEINLERFQDAEDVVENVMRTTLDTVGKDTAVRVYAQVRKDQRQLAQGAHTKDADEFTVQVPPDEPRKIPLGD